MGKDKKRKKKQYKTPKKDKHVHKKVKCNVLKFYKVSSDGQIERLRPACPECGAGIRMANHADRQHCGKCGNTYYFE